MKSPETWRGIPMPSPTELFFLEQETGLKDLYRPDDLEETDIMFGPYRLLDLAEEAKILQLRLDEITEFAVNYYLEEEADLALHSEEEHEEFSQGVGAGLDYFIGCMTYIQLLRHSVDVEELDLEHLPLCDDEQQSKARFIREVGTLFDPKLDEELFNIARNDFADFCYDNPAFVQLLEAGYDCLAGEDPEDALERAFLEGYFDGLEFGLQIYLVSTDSASI